MLIDMHAHSSKVSRCCRISCGKGLEVAKEYGMDGFILTNHYDKAAMGTDTLDAYIEKYIQEFYDAKGLGKEKGCKVFFGMEVTMEFDRRVHLLIYGLEPDFLRQHPLLFDMTQKELYALVQAAGGLLVQAHPFRGGTTVLDTEFLDGVEINCHPLYKKSYSQELLKIAEENKLIVTCGGDYHADTYRPKCGMEIPETVQTTEALRDFLLSPESKTLCIHEPDGECDLHEIPAFHCE